MIQRRDRSRECYFYKLKSSFTQTTDDQKVSKSDLVGDVPRTHSIVQQMVHDKEHALKKR